MKGVTRMESEGQEIKMEVINCFNEEVKNLRLENIDILRDNAVMHSSHVSMIEESEKTRVNVEGLKTTAIESTMKISELEKAINQHNAKHENNYEKLQEEYKSLQKNLGAFKGDVLRRLDSMGGRDSVLKVLFGGIIGAVILGLINQYLGL